MVGRLIISLRHEMASFMFFLVVLSRLAQMILNTLVQTLNLYPSKWTLGLNRFSSKPLIAENSRIELRLSRFKNGEFLCFPYFF